MIETEKLTSLDLIPIETLFEAIERLFLFCTIWTYGGSLDESKKHEFSDILKQIFKKHMIMLPGL